MNSYDNLIVFSVGHSTLSYERLLTLLRDAGATAVVDVRSTPYSRFFPHFNGETLSKELKADGIQYVFLEKELGGRPKEERYFSHGVADYEKMATASAFDDGLKRVVEGSKLYRIALMCSEHDPLDCHRCLLVGRALKKRGLAVRHILGNGSQLDQSEIEDQLLSATSIGEGDLFVAEDERLSTAYRTRSRKVAYSKDARPKQASAK